MIGKVLRTVKKKHKLWKKYKQHNSKNTKQLEYERQVNKARKAIRSAKKEFEQKICQKYLK